MAPTRALAIHNPPPRSPSFDSPPTSPSRFKRSIKGMRNLLMRHGERELETADKDGLAVAVTLTAEVKSSASMDILQPKNETFEFLSQQEHHHGNNIKAYVHYEPSRALIAVGNNPDTKHAKILWLTLEQYAWIVRQLQQEQSAHDTIRSLSAFHPSPAPLLGIVTEFTQTSLTRRLSRLMQRAKQRTLLLLPKSLLMHAAAYVPMTKPLPPPLPSKHYQEPFETLPQDLHARLYRYVRLVALSMHELQYDQDNNLTCKCSDPSMTDIKVIPNSSDISSSTIQGDATFPIPYLHTSLDQRRRTFDSYPVLPSTPTSSSRPKTYSAIECVTDSVIDVFDPVDTDKRGYIAMDDENEEIIVTFPGIPASGLLFENTSFMPVPWHESDESFREEWVLECAVAAWRRCELTVATALMRVCRTTPYRVVIIGHSLGGGKTLKKETFYAFYSQMRIDPEFFSSRCCIMCFVPCHNRTTC
ncbi:hypothetical protein BJV82DRAFT_250375 [Fennellomyces sp. T-0311]|nr:hypothetical protein BJV82DRAFT_250375 [Fennellomyces sp. T-0311]